MGPVLQLGLCRHSEMRFLLPWIVSLGCQFPSGTLYPRAVGITHVRHTGPEMDSSILRTFEQALPCVQLFVV